MGGLSSDSCEVDLREYFEQFGKVRGRESSDRGKTMHAPEKVVRGLKVWPAE